LLDLIGGFKHAPSLRSNHAPTDDVEKQLKEILYRFDTNNEDGGYHFFTGTKSEDIGRGIN
jgi:hypothetical protein